MAPLLQDNIKRETPDKSGVNTKRKRSEEADKDQNNLSREENDSSGFKIKTFASMHAKELNVSFGEN